MGRWLQDFLKGERESNRNAPCLRNENMFKMEQAAATDSLLTRPDSLFFPDLKVVPLN